MSFHYKNETHNVRACLPEVFDGFIQQAVEEIVNVDRSKWPVFQRWRAINACLPDAYLLLEDQGDGSLLLLLNVELPEEVSSTSEEKASDCTIPGEVAIGDRG